MSGEAMVKIWNANEENSGEKDFPLVGYSVRVVTVNVPMLVYVAGKNSIGRRGSRG